MRETREREGDSSIACRRGACFHFQGSPNGGYKQIEPVLEGRWMSGRDVDMLVFIQLASYNLGGVEEQNEKTPGVAACYFLAPLLVQVIFQLFPSQHALHIHSYSRIFKRYILSFPVETGIG